MSVTLLLFGCLASGNKAFTTFMSVPFSAALLAGNKVYTLPGRIVNQISDALCMLLILTPLGCNTSKITAPESMPKFIALQ